VVELELIGKRLIGGELKRRAIEKKV